MDVYKKLKDEFTSLMDGSENESNPSIKKKLGSLLDKVETSINVLNKKRTALFFPKQASKLKKDNEQGYLEERTAIEFLASPQSSDAIISRLNNCMELGQIDYMSFIYKKLILQIPKSETEWEKLPKDRIDFFRTIERMYNHFINRSGIDFFDKQLEMIGILQKRILDLNK